MLCVVTLYNFCNCCTHDLLFYYIYLLFKQIKWVCCMFLIYCGTYIYKTCIPVSPWFMPLIFCNLMHCCHFWKTALTLTEDTSGWLISTRSLGWFHHRLVPFSQFVSLSSQTRAYIKSTTSVAVFLFCSWRKLKDIDLLAFCSPKICYLKYNLKIQWAAVPGHHRRFVTDFKLFR